ncbi:hypothetical protein ACOXXX_01160 [Thalassococcus sp. BH17M4-6]|uniref:hypothetical protein n=1 Tax=Thalassococcus sp. BH17M4-6 TaxID=3413148 RepID=UPI003BD881B9
MRTSTAALLLALCPLPLGAQAPLSAIDWLEAQAATPQLARPATPRSEPPVAQTALVPEVETMPLGAPTSEAAGLLPMQVTGLPLSLWQASESATLIDLIGAVDPAVPALNALLHTLLLAEANPPKGPRKGAPLLAARLDRLLAQGVVDPAEALVERANARTAELFPIWFDIALLTGREDEPCAALMERPSLSRDLSARVFCSARTGRYDVAVTTLETGRALGTLVGRDVTLLTQFLDPVLSENSAPPRAPVRPTPLQFRLFEAIGEPLSTAALPRAFANVDLGGDSGWKAQLEAAERLARVGAISENRLLGIYSLQRRAASGGVWDRVEAVQAFEAALDRPQTGAVGPALQKVWPQMTNAGLLLPFARLFGPRLEGLELDGRAAVMAARAQLLSEDYEAAAAALSSDAPEVTFLRAIAAGNAPDPVPAALPHARAVAAAFDDAAPPAELSAQLDEGRLGEVILRAIALFSSGAAGNPTDLTDALATLRAVGLEDTARRAALQLVILDQEGARR